MDLKRGGMIVWSNTLGVISISLDISLVLRDDVSDMIDTILAIAIIIAIIIITIIIPILIVIDLKPLSEGGEVYDYIIKSYIRAGISITGGVGFVLIIVQMIFVEGKPLGQIVTQLKRGFAYWEISGFVGFIGFFIFLTVALLVALELEKRNGMSKEKRNGMSKEKARKKEMFYSLFLVSVLLLAFIAHIKFANSTHFSNIVYIVFIIWCLLCIILDCILYTILGRDRMSEEEEEEINMRLATCIFVSVALLFIVAYFILTEGNGFNLEQAITHLNMGGAAFGIILIIVAVFLLMVE